VFDASAIERAMASSGYALAEVGRAFDKQTRAIERYAEAFAALARELEWLEYCRATGRSALSECLR
jgi:hypothetical protein